MRKQLLVFGSSLVVLLLLWSTIVAQYDLMVSPDVNIRIDRHEDYLFLEEPDIDTIIQPYIAEKDSFTIQKVNLQDIERAVTTNPYVEEVQAYVSVGGQLHVDVKQRRPIFRVFNSRGVSFYVDKQGSIIPLSSKFTARVPIVTGFNDIDFPGSGSQDTTYTKFHQLVELAKRFHEDPFLESLVEQVYVNSNDEFEMVPKIDAHVIRLGNMQHLDDKLLRLKVFYREALVKFGWDRYQLIDLSYKGQIVCRKKSKV